MATNRVVSKKFHLCGFELIGPVKRRFLPEGGGLLVVQTVDDAGKINSFDVWPAPGLRSMADQVESDYCNDETLVAGEMRYSYLRSTDWKDKHVLDAYDKILSAFYPGLSGHTCTGFNGPLLF